MVDGALRSGEAKPGKPVVARILMPTDLTEWAEGAVDYGIALAAQLGAELWLFVVIDSPTIVTLMAHAEHRDTGGRLATGKDPGKGGFHDKLVADARRILQQDVDRAAAKGVRALGHVKISEDSEREILAEARRSAADLIVMMAPERHGLAELLIRSTAEEIMRRAPCPVMILRSRPRD
jgi:nucleotide-binding universal stress UspA family protein